MKDKKLKIIIAIVIFLYTVVGFVFGYLIGHDIGKQKASYAVIITIEPAPKDIEPKPSKGEGKI